MNARSAARWSAAFFCLASLSLIACSDPSEPEMEDAGGARDAGKDAGQMDRADGGKDAAASDAGKKTRVPCDERAGELRGKTVQSVQIAGKTRSFVLYAPESLDPTKPAPVVVLAHGYLQKAEQMVVNTNYTALADREGFVAIFPEGEPGNNGPWNVGSGACASSFGFVPASKNDDQAFLDALLEFVEDDQCLDRDHVFATGFSMGGYFANETGCVRDEVRAIAAHSAGSHVLTACPVERKPVLLLHGTGDQLIPLACGEEARARWAEHNGCSTEVDVETVMGGTCEYSKDCPEDAQVALCKFEGMNHGWAGGPDVQVSLYPGPYETFESASELSWSFFKEHAW
jgi:polyhydroxybutyrate depolymerase